jgi:hypothetical protein
MNTDAVRNVPVFLGDEVSLHGYVPIKQKNGDDTETNMLAFCIEARSQKKT